MDKSCDMENMCENIQNIIEKIVGRKVGLNDNLISSGLQSIELFQIIVDLNEEYSVEISFQDFIEHNSISKIVQLINKVVQIQNNQEKKSHIPVELPLTNIQRAYIAGRGNIYQMGNLSTLFLAGLFTDVDPISFEKAFRELIRRQEALSSTVTKKGKLKLIDNIPEYCVNYNDFTRLSPQEIGIRMEKIKQVLKSYRFGFDEWPMFRIEYIKLQESRYYIFFCMDMVICDGVSIGLLLKQVDEIIKGQNYKEKQVYPYSQYLVNLSNTRVTEKDRKYWMNQIDNSFLAPQIPIHNGKLENVEFLCMEKRLSGEEIASINKILKPEGVTINSFFAALYVAVLSEWSGQSELVINVPVNNRPKIAGSENTIGDFTNILLLKAKGQSDLLSNAKQIQRDLYNHLVHQSYDGVALTRDISKQRAVSYSEILFPYVYTPISMNELSNDRNLFQLDSVYSQTTQVYLDFQLINTGKEIRILWNYVNGLFDQEVIKRWFDRMIQIEKEYIGGLLHD